jgi:hypothetical protein
MTSIQSDGARIKANDETLCVICKVSNDEEASYGQVTFGNYTVKLLLAWTMKEINSGLSCQRFGDDSGYRVFNFMILLYQCL